MNTEAVRNALKNKIAKNCIFWNNLVNDMNAVSGQGKRAGQRDSSSCLNAS